MVGAGKWRDSIGVVVVAIATEVAGWVRTEAQIGLLVFLFRQISARALALRIQLVALWIRTRMGFFALAWCDPTLKKRICSCDVFFFVYILFRVASSPMHLSSSSRHLLLLLLVVGFGACVASNVRAETLSERLAEIQHLAPILHTEAQGLYNRYHAIRKLVLESQFPVHLFPDHFSRLAKNAEKESLQLTVITRQFNDELLSYNASETLQSDIDANRWFFAHIALEELNQTINSTVANQLKQVVQQAGELSYVMFHNCNTSLIGNDPDCPFSFYALVIFGTILLWCLIVQFVVRRFFSIPAGCGVMVWTFPILLFLVLQFYVVVNGPSEFNVVRCFSKVYATMVSLDNLRHLVPTPSNDADVLRIILCTERITEHLQWMLDYANGMHVFNETVLGAIQEFSHRLSIAHSDESSNSPEVALQLVLETRERIQRHKNTLERLALTRQQRNDKGAQLDVLLSFIQAFELFFSRMEISIYMNLRTGLDVNQFFAENLEILYQHIRDGKFAQCLHILNEMYRQYNDQLDKLRQANKFVSAANDAISSVRLESTRLQPPLRVEEMEAWVQKLGYRATVSGASFAPLLGPLLLPGLSNPITGIPLTAACITVAVVGYNWSKYYEQVEADSRIVLTELVSLDKVMEQTENQLTAHETMLSMLMQEILGVMTNVNKSSARFGHIQPQRHLSERELQMLDSGVNRVKQSVATLSQRYQLAMDTLFARIVQAAQTRQAALSATADT
jgi:hypothetical protein